MSFSDKLDEVKYQLGRFLLPTLFLVGALILMKIALFPEYEKLNNGELLEVKQSKLFIWGAVFFLLASVIWILYVLGIIKTIAGYIIMVVMVGGSAWLLYHDYSTVADDVSYNKQFDKIDRDIRARMHDLKAAQVAYKDYYRKYTSNMDTLIWFVKNGKKMSVPNIGTLPSRTITAEERDYIYGDDRPIDRLMTDQEANKLAKMPNPPADLVGFSRDTVYLAVMDAVFKDEKFREARGKIEASLNFHPDSLRYIPHSGQKPVMMDTSSVQKGDLRVPTLQLQMIHPMDPLKVYQIGDLNDNHLKDNWSR